MIKPVIIFLFPFEMGSSYVTKVPLSSLSHRVLLCSWESRAALWFQPAFNFNNNNNKKIVARGGPMSDRTCSVPVLGPE